MAYPWLRKRTTGHVLRTMAFFLFWSQVMKDQEFLTLPEVARLLRATPPTIRSWISQGIIPRPISINRKRLFPASELTRALSGLKDRKLVQRGSKGGK